MRLFLWLVLFSAAPVFISACASAAAENAAKPAATQPANPLNSVTNPMNQPGPDAHNTMH